MGPGVPSSRVAASLAVRVENTERLERVKRSVLAEERVDHEASVPMPSSWAAIMAASEKRTELSYHISLSAGLPSRLYVTLSHFTENPRIHTPTLRALS